MDKRRVCSAALGIAAATLTSIHLTSIHANAEPAWRFHLEEATIADVHRAIRAKQITATQLVSTISSASKRTTAPASKATSIRRPACSSARSRRSRTPAS